MILRRILSAFQGKRSQPEVTAEHTLRVMEQTREMSGEAVYAPLAQMIRETRSVRQLRRLPMWIQSMRLALGSWSVTELFDISSPARRGR